MEGGPRKETIGNKVGVFHRTFLLGSFLAKKLLHLSLVPRE